MPPPKVSNLRLELLKAQDDSSNSVENAIVGIMTVTSLSESLQRSYPSRSLLDKSNSNSSLSSLNDSYSSKKAVSFSTVSFRHYERTVGDHPAVSGGPALDFTWEYSATEPQSVVEYELRRSGRRTGSEMIIRRTEREYLLRSDFGVSRTDLALHVRNINKIKNQRRQTLNNLRFSKIEENWQKFLRFFARCVGARKKTDRQIKELWRRASDLSNSSRGSATLDTSNSSRRRQVAVQQGMNASSSSKKSNLKKVKVVGEAIKKKLRDSSSKKSNIDMPHRKRYNLELSSGENELDLNRSNHRNLRYDLTEYEHNDDDDATNHESVTPQTSNHPAHKYNLVEDKSEIQNLQNITNNDIASRLSGRYESTSTTSLEGDTSLTSEDVLSSVPSNVKGRVSTKRAPIVICED
jgi:hypothetical protein